MDWDQVGITLDAIAINSWNWVLEKITFNLNYWIKFKKETKNLNLKSKNSKRNYCK